MGKKGFGESKTPTRDAKRLIQAFIDRIAEAKDNETQIQEFLKSKQARLDESLLEALPQVFATLTADKPLKERRRIAQVFVNFGASIQQFPLGQRSLNLELSITAYQLALKVLTRKTFPEEWAATQNNLGAAYGDRLRGERAENLERAIAAFELALQIRTREAFPEEWAGAQNNLGIAYCERIRGERAENLERAIAAYELALQVYVRETIPKQWALIQNNLGIAYCNRIRGERAENLERAIVAYELALQVRTCEAFPEEWAATQNNLGNAYRDRLRGERAENLERAISAYELALQIYTREAFPEEWARVQHNLANAYRDRLRGEQAENLEQAILIYGQASQVFTRESFPEKWAANQGHLAEAFMKRASLTNNPADLDTAIALLQEALAVSVPGSPDFIDSQYRLGNALSRRYESSQNSRDLEQALQAYRIALDAISPEHYDRHQIWQALPTTQAVLGSRLVREGQWQEGLQLLLNSVSQLRTDENQLAHASALFQTGRSQEVLSDWDNARLYYRDALRLYEHLKDLSGIARSRAGLGGVLVSQGHLQKGMAQLLQAREGYYQLNQLDKVAEVESLYQTAQRVLEG